VAAGALTLAVPTSAVALAAGQADAQSAISLDVSRSHLDYGQHLTVTGRAPALGGGRTLLLQFSGPDGASWRTLGSATSASDGSFRFITSLHQSGLLRAIPSGAGASALAASAGASSSSGPSSPRPVYVEPEFRLRRSSIDVLGGHAAVVRGRLLPGVAGRPVRLEGRSGGRWHALAAARTGTRGAFEIRYRPAEAHGAAGQALLVQFRGDRRNSRTSARAGRVIVFRQSLASWYNDGGATACGFHAGLGVANRTLPCGTRVRFRYGGRTVTAVVDDRGPYVGAREWDLNENTAGALGFGGVGMVWSAA
jgi:hypothetical protein